MRKTKHSRFGLALFCLCAATPASYAGLCGKDVVKARHTTEANNLAREMFATTPPGTTLDYKGSTDYNARVIACNRRRDTKSGEIERKVAPNHVFPDNLPARLIKGHFNYFGTVATQLRYMYQLERIQRVWTLTVPAEFHFPALKDTKFLDITMPLAKKLGIDLTVCATTELTKKKVTRGLVPDSTGDKAEWTDPSCRVGRDESFTVGGVTKDIKDWYMDFWREQIETSWTHHGFKLKFKIINFNEVSAADLKKYQKHETIWHVRLSMNVNVIPRYKANPLFLHPLYSGLDTAAMVHEFGHVMGLDDEYPPQECEPLGGSAYIMCDAFHMGLDRQKAVYAWLSTRRYEIGETF